MRRAVGLWAVLAGCTFSPAAVDPTPDGSSAPDGALNEDGAAWDADPRMDSTLGQDAAFVSACDQDGLCELGETESGCPADCCNLDCASGCGTCCRTSSADSVCSATGACLCYHDCAGNGDTCTTVCSGTSTCRIDCRDSTECYPTCSGDSTCLIDCRGITAECHVECSSSDCLLYCEGAASCEFTQCSGGSRQVTNCGGGVFVCDQDGRCP
jgi:hypothetical protein